LLVAIKEMIKAVLILVKREFHLVLAAQIAFFILNLFHIDQEKYDQMQDDYKKIMKACGIYTIIGAPFFIWVAISELIK
jgi:hypothetical protein